MKMTPDIKLIVEDGKKTYLAPERSEIRIKLDFRTKKQADSISEPYLVRRGVEQACDWGDFFGHTMSLSLGRYVQASELAQLKSAISPHLQVVRLGYRRVDDKTFAIFDNSALRAIDDLHRVMSAFSFEFEQPYYPDAAFAETILNMTDIDLAYLSRYPNSKLKTMAVDYSKRCYPHMHPWDAYVFLAELQENLKKRFVSLHEVSG